jgi:hypothetical protein
LSSQTGSARNARRPTNSTALAMGFYFRSFVEFYFPLAYGDIDWDAGFVSLETELRQIAGKSRASPLRSDSLFEVKRLSGAAQRVLIHAIYIHGEQEIILRRSRSSSKRRKPCGT